MEDDLQKIITPSDTSKFSTSPIARDALKVLGAASQGQDISISRNEYTVVRDYLTSDTILRNANRPGVLISYNESKRCEGSKAHISIHKTSGYTHQPRSL